MTKHQKEDLAIKYFSLYKRRFIHLNIITIDDLYMEEN